MQNLAKQLVTTPEHEAGWLVRGDGDVFVVKTDRAVVHARRAPSCLVLPEPGDLVLVASLDAGAFVIAILDRAPGRAATISVDGDLAIKLPTGSFTVTAQEGIEIAAEEKLEITAATLEVEAARGEIHAGEASLVAALVKSEIERVKVIARSVESVFGLVTERVKRAYRKIEEFEQVRADRIDYQAKRTLSLHGENTILTAEELVKVDGEQIHLG